MKTRKPPRQMHLFGSQAVNYSRGLLELAFSVRKQVMRSHSEAEMAVLRNKLELERKVRLLLSSPARNVSLDTVAAALKEGSGLNHRSAQMKNLRSFNEILQNKNFLAMFESLRAPMLAIPTIQAAKRDQVRSILKENNLSQFVAIMTVIGDMSTVQKETLLQSKKVHSAKLMKMKAAVNKILLLESYISEKSSISHQELRMTEQRLSELYQKQCSLRNSLSAEHSLSKTDRMISVVTKLLLEWNALVLEISTVLKSQLEGVSTRLGTKLQSSDTLAPGSSMAPNIYFLDEAKSEQRCTDLQAKLQALKDKKNSLEGIIKSLSLDGEPSAKAKEQKFRALEALAEQNSEPKLKVIHKSISLKNTKENHSLAKHEHTKQAKALTAQLISATEATLEVKTFYSRLSTVALPDVAEKEARLRESIVKQEAVQQFLFAVLNDEFDVSNDNIKTDDACKQLHSISKRLLEEKKCNSLAGKLRNATKDKVNFG
eukprot:g75.t1